MSRQLQTFQPRRSFTTPAIINKPYIPIKQIDQESLEQLFASVLEGDFNRIKTTILDKYITPNITNSDGESLIHTVLQNNSTGMTEDQKYELIKYLIEHDVPINAYNKDNITALHLAAKYQYPKIVKLLLKSGANPNALDRTSMNPLHYAVQGNIESCKKRKKVGSLIPKNYKNMVESNELKDLTITIIDILNTDTFNQYIKHIKNTFKKLQDIYEIDLENLETDFVKDIVTISTDSTKNIAEKNNLINNKIINLTNDINNLVLNKLPKTINPLQIANYGTKTNLISNQILPKENPETINSTLSAKFNKDMNIIFQKLTTEYDKLNTTGNKLLLDSNAIYNNIHKIIQFNCNAKINRNIINPFINIPPDVLDMNPISLILRLLYPDTDTIEYHEINISGTLHKDQNILDRFLPSNEYGKSPIEIVRGTQNKRNEWKKQGIKKIYAKPLTNDARSTMTPGFVDVPLVGPEPEKFGPLTGPITCTLMQPGDTRVFQRTPGTFFDNQPYYYVSKFIFSITQIAMHIDAINNNFKTLKDHLSSGYYYNVYDPIISNILLSCYNIFQNILFANKEKVLIRSVTNELKENFQQRFLNNETHPYSYLLEYIIDSLNEINDLFNSLLNGLQIIYGICYTIIEDMNSIIDTLNTLSSIIYQKSFFNDFTNKNINPYRDTYDRNLNHLILPPVNYTEYENIFGKYTDLNLLRKHFYENYAPQIHIKNYSNYIVDNIKQFSPATMPTGTFISSTASLTSETQPFNEITGPIKPISGILAPLPMHSNGSIKKESQLLPIDIELKYKGYGLKDENNALVPTSSLNNDATTTILRSNNPNKIGKMGSKVFKNTQKQIAAPSSIKNTLDSHLYIIKYWLTQKVIDVFNNPDIQENGNYLVPTETFRQQIKQVKDRFLTSVNPKFMELQTNIILSITVGRITDELLILHIKNSIFSAGNQYVKNLVDGKSISRDYSSIFNDVTRQSRNIVFKTDTNFETNITKLYDDIIQNYYNVDVDNFDDLMYTVNVMEPESNIKEQFQLYNSNYASFNDIIEPQCYKVNPMVIDELLNSNISVNAKDLSGSSPIFYAIELGNSDIINKLINNKANIVTKTVKNNTGVTPYKYALNLYNHHTGYLNDNYSIVDILNRFTKPVYDQIKESLESNPDYKNNIIRYMDIIFPQLILMYNNLYYFYAKSYVRNWTFEKQQSLQNLLLNNNLISSTEDRLPLLTNFNESAIKNSIKLDALTQKIGEQDQSINQFDRQIDNFNNMIINLNKELNKLQISPDKNSSVKINQLTSQINDISKQRDNLINLKNELSNNKTSLNNTLNNQVSGIYDNLLKKADNFVVSEKYLGGVTDTYDHIFNEVSRFYNNIFDYVIENTPLNQDISSSGYEDYFLYNRIWKDLINDNNRLKNIFHIHLVTTLLQKKIIDNMNINSDNIEQLLQNLHDQELTLLDDLYKNIFVPSIHNMNDLPQYYNSKENYMLNEVLDIITHIVTHVISSNLYYAIIKVITKYFMTINPKEYELNAKTMFLYKKNKDNYNKFIKELVNNIIDPNYNTPGTVSSPNLYNYILHDMPKQLVKLKLKIYQNELDEQRSPKSIDELFQNIINILITNTVIPIQGDSTLITTLNNYIFRYYKDVFDLIIPKMKIVIDNYNRYILNDSRFVEMIKTLNNKVINEKIVTY